MNMKIIKLLILAQDIRESDYCSPDDCAMTRALRRAGLKAWECGGTISRRELMGFIDTPNELRAKVKGMYVSVGQLDSELEHVSPIEPADFEFELEVPDNWMIA
jgi:hypothetical protein